MCGFINVLQKSFNADLFLFCFHIDFVFLIHFVRLNKFRKKKESSIRFPTILDRLISIKSRFFDKYLFFVFFFLFFLKRIFIYISKKK